MARGKLRKSCYPVKLRALLSLLLCLALMSAAACVAPTPPPPPFRAPSKVITEEGMEFYVYGLKLPGTSQELKLKEAGTTTWLPLSVIEIITFLGPEDDRFRPAEVVLTSGEHVKGDLFVGTLIEGNTDLGYWNVALAKVRQIGMGAE